MRPRQLSTPFKLPFKFIGIAFLLFILFLVSFFIEDSVFKVKHIIVERNDKSIHVEGLELLENQSTIFSSKQLIEKRLIEVNPIINNVLVTFIYPDTVKLQITFQKPVADFKTTDGLVELNEEGKIISKLHKENDINYPTITYYQKYSLQDFQIGDFFDHKDILTALTILKYAKNMNYKIDSVDITASSMIVCKVKGKHIYFTTEKDREKQLYEFGVIVRQFKIQGKEFKSLDLRFSKPIVQF